MVTPEQKHRGLTWCCDHFRFFPAYPDQTPHGHVNERYSSCSLHSFVRPRQVVDIQNKGLKCLPQITADP